MHRLKAHRNSPLSKPSVAAQAIGALSPGAKRAAFPFPELASRFSALRQVGRAAGRCGDF